MTGEARVGCSGWAYKDWRGIVYPAGVPSFWDLLSGRLRTVVVTTRELSVPPELARPESLTKPRSGC